VRELIAVVYADRFRAAEVLAALRRLHSEPPPDLDHAVSVTHDAPGSLTLHYAQDVTRVGSELRFWRSLLGSLIAPAPPAGGAGGPDVTVGEAVDPARGRPPVCGVSGAFLEELRAQLGPGTSAVLLRVRDVTRDRLAPRVSAFGGTLLRTPLPAEGRSGQSASGYEARTSGENGAAGRGQRRPGDRRRGSAPWPLVRRPGPGACRTPRPRRVRPTSSTSSEDTADAAAL
jgi:uncharacterized membrane protein